MSRRFATSLLWLCSFFSNDAVKSLGFLSTATTSRTPWTASSSLNSKNKYKSAQTVVHGHHGNESDIAELIHSEETNGEQEEVKDGRKNKGKKKTETLRFGGQYNYRSPVFSMSSSTMSSTSTDENSLYSFLNEESIQHLLLSGGKDGSTIEKVPNETIIESDLISKWNEQIDKRKQYGTVARPDPSSDSIVTVTPPAIELVTVSIIPTTTIGTKLIQVEESLDGGKLLRLPEFQATLIADEPRAIGPKFLVWLFNKVTYGGNPDEINEKDENSQNKRSESALLRLRVEPVATENEGNDNRSDDSILNFVFVAESSMLLEFEFPKLLLRFFPMKKRNAEELCSDSIVKALEKNMLPAMEAFCKEYTSFVK